MSVPNDNDQPQTPEPRAWVVRAGRDGAEEQYNLDNHIVSVGWGELGGEVESFANREDFG